MKRLAPAIAISVARPAAGQSLAYVAAHVPVVGKLVSFAMPAGPGLGSVVQRGGREAPEWAQHERGERDEQRFIQQLTSEPAASGVRVAQALTVSSLVPGLALAALTLPLSMVVSAGIAAC